jgi:hypothetical protein
MLFAAACLNSGHTGRLPLIVRPQFPWTKWDNQARHCCGSDPFNPLTFRYCATFAADARGFWRR